MPGLMESFATGYNVPTQMAQSDVALQQAQLQKQYMPEEARLNMVQKQQATSMQSLQLQTLADTIKGDQEVASVMKDWLPQHPDAKPVDVENKLAKEYYSLGKPKEGLAHQMAATKAAREASQEELDGFKQHEAKMKAGHDVLAILDPTNPEAFDKGALDFVTKHPGTNLKSLSDLVSKNEASGMSPTDARKSAQETLLPLMKSANQVNAEKMLVIKEKQEEDSAKRIENQSTALMASIQSREATLALGYAREDRMNKQETNKEAKVADDKKAKERLLFNDQRKTFESLHTKYLKARGLATSSDDKIALDETYQQDLESKNGEFRNEFSRLGIPYTEMATPHTAVAKPTGTGSVSGSGSSGEAPPYGSWAANARSLNPGVSPEELKSAYEKRYGSKTQGSSSSPTPKQMPPDLRKEYGDINMRLSLPGISDTKKLELLLRKKEIEKSLNKPWKKYD